MHICLAAVRRKKKKKSVAGSLNLFSPAALHNDAALSHADGEGKSIHNSKKQRGAGAAAVSRNNKLRRRKLNLYLLMEAADCIIHSAGASECVGNGMYDGWPSWRSSPLRWAVHLFICLFIYSLIQRSAHKHSGFVLRRGSRGGGRVFGSFGKCSQFFTVFQLAGFSQTSRGQGVALPTLSVCSLVLCVCAPPSCFS